MTWSEKFNVFTNYILIHRTPPVVNLSNTSNIKRIHKSKPEVAFLRQLYLPLAGGREYDVAHVKQRAESGKFVEVGTDENR